MLNRFGQHLPSPPKVILFVPLRKAIAHNSIPHGIQIIQYNTCSHWYWNTFFALRSQRKCLGFPGCLLLKFYSTCTAISVTYYFSIVPHKTLPCYFLFCFFTYLKPHVKSDRTIGFWFFKYCYSFSPLKINIVYTKYCSCCSCLWLDCRNLMSDIYSKLSPLKLSFVN